MKKTIAYIAHPVQGDVAGNIEKILAIVKDINFMYADVVPFVPYLADLMALDDSVPEERARGISNGTTILKSGLVNELWLYGRKITTGMKAEIALAWDHNIPIIARDPAMKIPKEYKLIIRADGNNLQE